MEGSARLPPSKDQLEELRRTVDDDLRLEERRLNLEDELQRMLPPFPRNTVESSGP
jgi:hypothetical protein